MVNVDLKSVTTELKSMNEPWIAGETNVSQLSQEEFIALLGYVPTTDSGELPLEAREAVASAFRSTALASSGITAPGTFDLRNVDGRNYITPIRNQLSCGSCVAFGVCATVEGTMRFAARDSNLAIDLSEGHLFQCIARSQGRTCAGATGGWWVDPALRALRDQGVTNEACSPYSPVDQPCGLCGDWQQRLVKISSYREIRSVQEMKEWLSTRGPMTACFSVYSDFSAYRSGIYRKTASAVLRGGHCVCVVGYDDAQRAWICKNSWGTGWGESGYFRIAYGECGIDASMWGIEGGAAPTPSGTYVPLYRYWNPSIGDHFYTTSWAELGGGRHGWGYEGVQAFVSATAQPGLVPLYRYWNPSIGDHFYTTSWGELGSGRYGWKYEGIQCQVAPGQAPGTIPLYRYWNSSIGDHFYTTSWDELGSGRHGWHYEGIQCYVWHAAAGAELASVDVPATFRAQSSAHEWPGTSSVPSGMGSFGAPSLSSAGFEPVPASFSTMPDSTAAASSFAVKSAHTKRGCGCEQ